MIPASPKESVWRFGAVVRRDGRAGLRIVVPAAVRRRAGRGVLRLDLGDDALPCRVRRNGTIALPMAIFGTRVRPGNPVEVALACVAAAPSEPPPGTIDVVALTRGVQAARDGHGAVTLRAHGRAAPLRCLRYWPTEAARTIAGALVRRGRNEYAARCATERDALAVRGALLAVGIPPERIALMSRTLRVRQSSLLRRVALALASPVRDLPPPAG